VLWNDRGSSISKPPARVENPLPRNVIYKWQPKLSASPAQ
jgi:hypothetical protein